MTSKPTNPKLWATIVAQARSRFSTYPSPGASHWVHKQYVQHGGTFVDTADQKRMDAVAARMRESASGKDDKSGKKG